jgi:hypothetical protein
METTDANPMAAKGMCVRRETGVRISATAQWRDAWQLEHLTGKYLVSDRTLTEDEWVRERGADVIEGELVAIEPPEGTDPSQSK